MAWSMPRTWASGEVLTAADMNVYVRDNQLVLSAHVHTGAPGDGGSALGPLSLTEYANTVAPAEPSYGNTRLYAVSGHLHYRSGDGDTPLADGGHTHDGGIGQGASSLGTLVRADFATIATPAAPGVNQLRLYTKNGLPMYRAGAAGVETELVDVTTTQTLQLKTLDTPTVSNFTNMQHDHTVAAEGGIIGIGALVTVFSANGSFVPDSGALWAEVYAWGGGGGGSSGGFSSSGNGTGASGGGGGGSMHLRLEGADLLAASPITVTIGSGGTGGAGVTTTNYSLGNSGSVGGDTSFGSFLTAIGGALATIALGGDGGGTFLNSALPNAAGFMKGIGKENGDGGYAEYGGGGGGSRSQGLGGNSLRGGGAGGGGGTSTPTNGNPGGAGGASSQFGTTLAGSGGAAGAAGTAGTAGAAGRNGIGGDGGGGGGGGANSDGGNGGNGGAPGGGGGGGGGSSGGTTSGSGGDGADGRVIVVEHFS